MTIYTKDYTERLFTLEDTVFCLTIMESVELDNLLRQLQEQYPQAIIRRIRGNKSTTVKDFFNEIGAALQFPLCFSETWDAFTRYITDLSWLAGQAHILLISDAAALLSAENNLQFEILARNFCEVNNQCVFPDKPSSSNQDYFPPFRVLLQTPPNEQLLQELVQRLDNVQISFAFF
jgi:hypothetical protein